MMSLQQDTYAKSLSPAVLNGTWSTGASWSFHLAESLPPKELITAVFCITFCPEGVVLTVTKRGHYEHLGGHPEAGESIEDTMRREVLEEGGVKLESFTLMAVRKIDNSSGVINKHTNAPYPPTAYIPFYIGFTDQLPEKPGGAEVDRCEVFKPEEALKLPDDKFPEKAELKLALRIVRSPE